MTTLSLPVSERDHAQGPAYAPVTLVEYGDYQCPYCAKAHPIVKQLQANLGDQLRFVFRNFPLTRIHPDALRAAVAAESVAELAGPVAAAVGCSSSASEPPPQPPTTTPRARARRSFCCMRVRGRRASTRGSFPILPSAIVSMPSTSNTATANASPC